VVEDKWLASLSAAVQGEPDRVSQTLTGRIRMLAERYAKPLPELESEVEALSAKVEAHPKQIGHSFPKKSVRGDSQHPPPFLNSCPHGRLLLRYSV